MQLQHLPVEPIMGVLAPMASGQRMPGATAAPAQPVAVAVAAALEAASMRLHPAQRTRSLAAQEGAAAQVAAVVLVARVALEEAPPLRSTSALAPCRRPYLSFKTTCSTKAEVVLGALVAEAPWMASASTCRSTGRRSAPPST